MHSKSLLASMLFAAAVITGPAQAQYPDKPINYILAFAPGGESDISARFQQPIFEKLGKQQAVIKYQAGAGGGQAWSQLNSMPGDGYTIMGTNLPHIVLQPIEKDVGYKTDDLVNVYFFHYTPDAIFVPIDSKFKTLKDLIDFAKKNPGQVTFAGSGSFTPNHLAQQRLDELRRHQDDLCAVRGLRSIDHRRARQSGDGGIQLLHDLPQPARQGAHARGGLRETRLPTQTDSPTFKELGIDLVGGAYRGLGVPKSTPENVRKEVSDLIGKINADPEFKKKMEESGFVLTDISYDKWEVHGREESRIRRASPRSSASDRRSKARRFASGRDCHGYAVGYRRCADACQFGSGVGGGCAWHHYWCLARPLRRHGGRDPGPVYLHDAAGIGVDRARRDLYRRDLWRCVFRHSGQYAGHAVFHRDDLRRLSDGKTRRRQSRRNARHTLVRGWRTGWRADSAVAGAAAGADRARFRPAGIFLACDPRPDADLGACLSAMF